MASRPPVTPRRCRLPLRFTLFAAGNFSHCQFSSLARRRKEDIRQAEEGLRQAWTSQQEEQSRMERCVCLAACARGRSSLLLSHITLSRHDVFPRSVLLTLVFHLSLAGALRTGRVRMASTCRASPNSPHHRSPVSPAPRWAGACRSRVPRLRRRPRV